MANSQRLSLIFGPQDPNLDDQILQSLRTTLLDTPHLEWLVDALTSLPQEWGKISSAHPELGAFQGVKYLQLLNDWVRRGTLPPNLFPLPNILVTPLVVTIQLSQYTTLVTQLNPGIQLDDSLQETLRVDTEIAGLCTGLLSAGAVASSASLTELHLRGAAAIRMATAIGALVDAGDTKPDTDLDKETKWQSLAVGWTSPTAEAELHKITARFPEAYVSVISEARLATLTVLKADAVELLAQLKAAGLIFTTTTLRGPFHCRQRESQAVALLDLFDADPSFQFPAQHAFRMRTANGMQFFDTQDKLHHAGARAMLTDQADWHTLFTAIHESTSSRPSLHHAICFGSQRFIPQWFLRKLATNLTYAADLDSLHTLSLSSADTSDSNAIAVIGMACHFPGGSDLDEFWDTLCAGESQCVPVPSDRVDFSYSAYRNQDTNRKWYGNFVRDHDVFDHRFFQKSPREMVSTDPQHRLMLQVAYQAVQQSGYFQHDSKRDVGCYVGIGVTDYENNVASHDPTAYTATGNLKSFAAGKISHFFGWSGPGVTLDTACSSSALAVHHACQAILNGECSAALAGGVNVMTSPEWYQNLDGASFLSPTGQCKPFDADADGYCRGEGAGAVFLKKLSDAKRDGDQVFGVIRASSVNQNENCSAITAPSVRSLASVFTNVLRKAQLHPRQISVVEAHGTGTQVGDRAEYDSVRTVLGGKRPEPLTLGSVKGLIGHLECASGIAALIKVVLMIQHGSIPPQPSFRTLNPKLNASPLDNIEISRRLRPWDAEFRAALLNNYGASGSNASLVVSQDRHRVESQVQSQSTAKRPFWFAGLDEQSLAAYAAKMVQFIQRKKTNSGFTLANLSFQLSRQSNRSLAQSLIFSCASLEELEQTLTGVANGVTTSKLHRATSQPQQSSRPVILCFGGQKSSYVGLDREAYEQFPVLRKHLDRCHEICLALGLPSGVIPGIFDRTPRTSIVELQTMQFALQYSCAMAWIDSGVQVAAVVGHSFGDLTALCVSGTLSIRDTLTVIIRRARLIEEHWGADRGSMIAVDGGLEDVQKLLVEHPTVNIACFNGPRNFTLAGTANDMELVRESLSTSSSIKGRLLDTTHAFHSPLVDPLVPELEKLGEDVIFRTPGIVHERAVETIVPGPPSFNVFASHMRDPVHFDKAVQRLAQKYPSGIWLEAGSNSGVTALASRAVGSTSARGAAFQSVNITGGPGGAVQNMTDVTVNLWKEGLNVSFWEHVRQDTLVHFQPLLLPPYQFAKSRHWLDRRKQEVKDVPVAAPLPPSKVGLWSFVGFSDPVSKTHARFQIHTHSEEFQRYAGSHFVAQTASICPSMLQHIITRDALASLLPGDSKEVVPDLEAMENDAPLMVSQNQFVWLDAEGLDNGGDVPTSWSFSITSSSDDAGTKSVVKHVSGRLSFRSPTDESAQLFTTYERLVDHRQALSLLDGHQADQVIQGSRNIYKAFAPVVQYNDDDYRGLQKLAAANNESAGRIFLKQKDKQKTMLSVGLADTFCQVAGIFLNCMTDCDEGKMYLSNRVDRWMRSPTLVSSDAERWEVYARHHQPSPKEWVSDLFVFDPVQGKLAWVVLGLRFVEVSISGMARLLTRLSGGQPVETRQEVVSRPATSSFVVPVSPVSKKKDQPAPVQTQSPPKEKKKQPKPKKSAGPDILGGVRALFVTLLGLEPSDIQPGSDLVELGIDSLLAMEVAREVEKAFSIKFELEELMSMTDVRSLVSCIQANLGASDSSATDDNTSEDFDVISTASGPLTPAPEDDEDAPVDVHIPAASIMDAFAATKRLTDQFIEANDLSGYSHYVQPKLTELVVAHTIHAFEQLGCSLQSAQAGETLPRIPSLPKHDKVMAVLLGLLENAGLVELDGSRTIMTRTATPMPLKSAEQLLQELLDEYPEHAFDHKLTTLTGTRLADCLIGKTEAIQLLFGSAEGRELAAGMYGKSPINVAWLRLLQHFWSQLIAHLPQTTEENPIRIMEMGAGTGGTTAALLPLLARAGIPVVYTATDISPSLVAGLRKRFRSEYPWMRFEVVDIEQPPPAHLLASQHVVLATNCVHATHSLAVTTKNIHRILRPDDGVLVMLEMTEAVPWVDSVFGLVEGWWLFNDGRQHALAQPEFWQKTLQGNGYGYVDWTDGDLPENSIQRVIVALASEQTNNNRVLSSTCPLPVDFQADSAARQVVIDSLVRKHTANFTGPLSPIDSHPAQHHAATRCVLVTGATGSLGSHLVADLLARDDVHRVVCLNRVSTAVDATYRQIEALTSRGLALGSDLLDKLQVIETDSSTPNLGLSPQAYQTLSSTVTDIIHNAWAMSMTRPVQGFEPQFKTMRHLIDLASACAAQQPPTVQISFQFISSVSVVGCHPFVNNWQPLIPEDRVTAASALPMGYASAKLVCEKMLDATLHQYPARFRAMSVRIGQISGSRVTGYWNPVEHLVHVIKSSQSLGVLPDLEGVLSWCPVDDVAATLGDLVLRRETAYPIYQIENPVRQSWPEMIRILAEELDIRGVVPYAEWVERVLNDPVQGDSNPAARLGGFFKTDFIRMSCGGVVLDTVKSREHSAALRAVRGIDRELVVKYLRAWKDQGFLE